VDGGTELTSGSELALAFAAAVNALALVAAWTVPPPFFGSGGDE
jgi:hypothetical protein